MELNRHTFRSISLKGQPIKEKTLPIILLLLIAVSACTPASAGQDIVFVDIDDLAPLPAPLENEVVSLQVVVAAVISPQGSAESYTRLMQYLGVKLHRPVESVQSRSYTEANEMVRSGEVDLAFVCTSSYLVGHEQFGMHLLAAPQVDGESVYRAQIIVHASSPARSLSDLRNSTFAFTDPISFTGRMYPTYLIEDLGETPEDFFSRTFFTYSHDDAIYAVANGVADAASVDSLVLNFALARDPGLAEKIQIIFSSPPFGMPPVVINPEIRPQLHEQLEDILLNMHLDPEGRDALNALGYDRFVIVDDSDYDSARAIEAAIQCCDTNDQ